MFTVNQSTQAIYLIILYRFENPFQKPMHYSGAVRFYSTAAEISCTHSYAPNFIRAGLQSAELMSFPLENKLGLGPATDLSPYTVIDVWRVCEPNVRFGT
jgi:hypothetical protein